MDDKLRAKLWNLVGQYSIGEDQIHGLPHIRRVYSYFRLFKKSDPLIDDDLLDALEYSTLFHDLGRKIYASDSENHALESKKMMKKLFRNELSALDVPNQDWILYSIANHSKGMGVRKAIDKRDFCLSLLVVFDHMDGIGAIGIYRNVTYSGFKIPLFPENDDFWKERIKDYLDHPEKITIDQIGMKKSSMIELLTYSYAATFHIIYPVREILKFSFQNEIEKKLEVTRDFIEQLFEKES